MYIKGITEYDKNGKEIKTCCIFGKATKDGELKTTNSGKRIASVSVKAFSKKDGSAEFITVKSWDGPFLKAIGSTEKGDAMMACGRLEEREYNGKTYVDMMVDYYSFVPANGSVVANFQDLCNKVDAFNAADDDGEELPF